MSSVVTHNPLAAEFRKKRVAGKPVGKSRLSSQAPFESAQRAIKKSIPNWKHKVSSDAYVAIGNICLAAQDEFVRHSVDLVDAGPTSTLTPSLAISAVLSTIECPKRRQEMNAFLNATLNKFYLEQK